MASLNTPDYITTARNAQIASVMSQVHDRLKELHKIIAEREQTLIAELESSRNVKLDDYIPANISQDMSLVNSFTHRNDQTRPVPSSFELDYSILEAVKSIGHFTYSDTPTNHTKGRSYVPKPMSNPGRNNPTVAVGKGGLAPGEFNVPRGLAIDPTTSNIYIADCVNHRVQVFNSDGQYLFHFGNERGENKMCNPWSICISIQGLYVTQFKLGAIHAYKYDGTFVNKTGSRGKGAGQFQYPEGLTNDVDGNVIICDRGNNRVQVLNGELNYLTEFGSEILKKPRDVKIVSEYVIVLDKSNPCLHVFTIRSDKSGVDHIQDMITQGQGEQVCKPGFFTLDGNNCILISDQWNHTIKCFSANGEYKKDVISLCNLYRPQGIDYDTTKHQIVCVCWNQSDVLQIFKTECLTK
ncbi:Serine/threonine-protein kinase PknD [Oopsacas minuta]|uniref:Serine/threonine-protein kinase PknD n=1 Tax=Oopsacas minuta TaxID=111878 RepID=A0AAV7JB11_9METZ|nr:Serine/threonine-protein kinase PknD [Oopsacas minuta]